MAYGLYMGVTNYSLSGVILQVLTILKQQFQPKHPQLIPFYSGLDQRIYGIYWLMGLV